MIKISVPARFVENLDDFPALKSLSQNISALGATRVTFENERYFYHDIAGGLARALKFPRIQELTGFGLEVWNFPAYFRMSTADLDNEVPDYLPKATEVIMNPEGIPDQIIRHTWRTWRDDTHPIQFNHDESEAVFGTNPFGSALVGSLIVRLISDGYTFLLPSEFTELRQNWYPDAGQLL